MIVRLAAMRLRVPEAAFRAVLRVECGSDDPTRWLGPEGRALIRVEAHHVLRRVAPGDHGLRIGAWRGGPGEPSTPWLGHEVRVDDAWWDYHGRQERASDGTAGEYDALDVAAQVLPDGFEGACACSSWGPGQVLGRYFAELGLSSALAVRDLAATPEGGLQLVERYLTGVNPRALVALRALDWREFAFEYNGAGQVEKYGGWLAREFAKVA